MRGVRTLLAAAEILGAACSAPRKAQPSAAAADLNSLVARGESTYYRAEFDSARMFWRSAHAAAVEAGDSAQEARVLTWLGLAAWKLGDFSQARSLGEQALALKLRGRLTADLFRSYNALGLLASDEGRLDDALLLYERAAQAARGNRDALNGATVANNIALVHTDQGEFGRARAGFVQAREAFHRLGDARREGRALNNLGALDVQLGDPGSAIGPLTDALALLLSIDDRAGVQNALGQLGTAYDALGEPHRAFAALDSALALSRSQGLRQEEASNLELVAGLHRQAGELQRALLLYDEANRINAELGLTMLQGSNLRNAAEIQATLGRLDLARSNALEALRLHHATGARLQELRDRLLLADLAATAALPAAVVEGHLRAAERLSVMLDARIARVEVALTRAAIADRSGNASVVLGTLSKARSDLARGGFGGEWRAAALRARAYSRISRFDSAAAAGREAVAAVERVRGGFGSSYLRSAFAADKAATYSDLVDILLRLGRTAEAFEVADGARSHALLEHLAATSNGATPPRATVRTLAVGEAMLRRIDTLGSRLDAIEETASAERDLAQRTLIKALATDLKEARGEYEALLVTVAEQDAAGTALLGGRSTSTAAVQRVLGPDEAVLEYLVTASRLIVFGITAQEVRSVALDVPREDLARRVRLARDLVGVPGLATNEHSEVMTALHNLLIAPLESTGLLRGMRRLIVIPHSVLSYLPFAALQREGLGRYLMEEYVLLHFPSAAALTAMRGTEPRGAMESGPVGGFRSAVFAPFPKALPGSVREARAFRRAVAGARGWEGSGATELRVREAMAGGGIVHIASHGVMNPRNPMFSRIELARGGGDPNDDGRLEVHELLALQIAAPLVFLSGCETGVGVAWSTQFSRGEDYATLAQAFLYAGARSVAATLWKIGDDGAAEFAERFYFELLSMAPAEALAAAQRALLRLARYSSPYYWASYQMIGDSKGGPGPHKTALRSVPQK